MDSDDNKAAWEEIGKQAMKYSPMLNELFCKFDWQTQRMAYQGRRENGLGGISQNWCFKHDDYNST